MKNKSILQQTKECYLCRLKAEKSGYFGQLPSTGLHRHHFMHGTANRKLAEKYGLYAYVCERFHHEHGEESPHGNPAVDLMLKQARWREVFLKSYKDMEGAAYIDDGGNIRTP